MSALHPLHSSQIVQAVGRKAKSSVSPPQMNGNTADATQTSIPTDRYNKRADNIVHTSDPLKDRTCGPTRAKGTTTIQHLRNIAQ